MNRILPYTVRRAAKTLSLLILGGFAACGEDPRPPLVADAGWQVEPMATRFSVGTQTPHLSPLEDGAVLSWWEEVGTETVLRFAEVTGEGIGPARDIVRGSNFFVNWADFPSVTRLPSGRLVAHWLERGDQGGYDYGVRVSTSVDGGESWDAPWTPHEDGTPTEHGFVSLQPVGDDGFQMVWLDGRAYVAGDHGTQTEIMSLRMRERAGDDAGAEEVRDMSVCDCCQTDLAWSSVGPILTYRNRTEDEIRDIYFTVRDGDVWSEPRAIHDDGWEIAACPVNGPAVAARGDFVVLTWFTAESERPRVQAAVSNDGGRSFGTPLRIDHGNPVGRVDVVITQDDRALISWVEGTGNRGAEIRLQEVGTEGLVGDWTLLTATSSARSSGFPQVVDAGDGTLIAAWTDSGESGLQLQVARLVPATN